LKFLRDPYLTLTNRKSLERSSIVNGDDVYGYTKHTGDHKFPDIGYIIIKIHLLYDLSDIAIQLRLFITFLCTVPISFAIIFNPVPDIV
jgi:hypothetical protein